jgi:hypothetical protein
MNTEFCTEILRNDSVNRQLTYDEAVDRAFPEDMFSKELSNGMPGEFPLARI